MVFFGLFWSAKKDHFICLHDCLKTTTFAPSNLKCPNTSKEIGSEARRHEPLSESPSRPTNFMSNNILTSIESNPQTIVMVTAGDLCELVERLIDAKTKKEQPIEQQGEEYLTSAQLKTIFGVSTSTIWRWKQAGLIRPVKIAGLLRYRKAEIMAMLNQQS